MTREHAIKLLRPFGLKEIGFERAFKRAAMKYHPDKGGSASAFRLICEARDLLRGMGGSGARARTASTTPPPGFGFGSNFERHARMYHNIFDAQQNMAEMMERVLQGWREQNEKNKG